MRKITLAPGGLDERKVDLSDVTIPTRRKLLTALHDLDPQLAERINREDASHE